MSKNIISDSKFEDRISHFWNLIRRSRVLDYRETHKVVGALIFAAADAKFIRGASNCFNRTFEQHISKFCYAQTNSENLIYCFKDLRRLLLGEDYQHLFFSLSDISEGLSVEEVKDMAKRILDRVPNRQRLDRGYFGGSKELAQLMLHLTMGSDIENPNVFIPYPPHASTASMVGEGSAVSCIAGNTEAASVIAVHQLAEGGDASLETVIPENDHSLFSRYKNYARIIAAPPFGGRLPMHHWSGWKFTDSFCIDQVAKNLRNLSGRAAICTSSNFLFRAHRETLNQRKDLIEEGLIESVIQLPEGNFGYGSLASSIIILNSSKLKSDRILVVNASDCTLKNESRTILNLEAVLQLVNTKSDEDKVCYISEEELAAHRYDLSPTRHVFSQKVLIPDGHRLISLKEILTELRTQNVQIEDKGIVLERKSFPDTTKGFEFSFDNAPVIQASELQKPSTYKKVTSSCLLVDCMASRGEIRAFWFSHIGKDLFVRPDLRAMKIDEKQADPEWVAMAINSNDVTDQVQAMLIGSVLPRIRVELLLNIRIALPDSLEKQRAIVRSNVALQIKAKTKEIGLEKLLEKQQKDFFRDIRLKKHTLSQITRDIGSRINVINICLKEKGSLHSDQLIGRQKVPVCDYLDHLANRCNELGAMINILTKIHVLSPPEDLFLEATLKSVKDKWKCSNFKLITCIHKDSFKDQETGTYRKPMIQLASKDFHVLCENIFNNAERHGFTENSDMRLIQIDTFLETTDNQERMVVISFKNTGKPLPQGLNTDRFTTCGEKGGVTGNTGIGGYHIKTIMNHANGKIEIYNICEDIFQVEVKLSFPFQS